MQLAANLTDLNLTGGQLGQAGGFFRNQDVFHLGEEGRAAPVVFHTGIQQVDVQGAGFELLGANAGRQGVVARDPLCVVLSLGVHEQVALLGRGREVHQGVGRN